MGTTLRKVAWPFALAAGIILTVALSVRTTTPWSPLAPPQISHPKLPDPVSSNPRSVILHLSFPIGELPQRPSELRWQPLAEAVLYRAEIRNVANSILHTCMVPGPQENQDLSCDLPALASLMPGARYSWRVLAFQETPENRSHDQPPTAVATSPWTDFSFGPPASKLGS